MLAGSYGGFRAKLAESSVFPNVSGSGKAASGPVKLLVVITRNPQSSTQDRNACLPMSLDDPAPRIPKRRSDIRSFSPGAAPRRREAFQVKRAGGVQQVPKGERRRSAPAVAVSREVAVGGLLLVVLFVVAGGLWLMGRSHGSARSGQGTGLAARTSEMEQTVWQGPVPSEVAEKFTKASTHAERLKWVRQPDRVGPAMEAFFREGPGSAEKITGTTALSTNGQGDFLYENYQVNLESGEPRLLCVSVDPRGAKVDFEAYARSCSEKWQDLVSGAVQSADEVRVILRPGGFFMHRFPDEENWVHFKATTPDLPDSMDFYVARDSEAARELGQGGEQTPHVTVSIRAVEDSAKYRQFEITAVKALGWVEPEE
jgi:hypothetical protein